MSKRYVFRVFIEGDGETPEQAWLDAVAYLYDTPGKPGTIVTVSDTERRWDTHDYKKESAKLAHKDAFDSE